MFTTKELHNTICIHHKILKNRSKVYCIYCSVEVSGSVDHLTNVSNGVKSGVVTLHRVIIVVQMVEVRILSL